MKIIAPITVIGIVLVGIFGPQDAVGAGFLMGLIILPAMAAVGVYEAWSHKRGPLGWIVNIPAAIVGGVLATNLSDILFTALFTVFPFEGRLADASIPLHFVMLVAMPVCVLFGSWGTLWLINLWRDRNRGVAPMAPA